MATKIDKPFKRGTRIAYTYAGGAVVEGKVLGPYSPDMPDWRRCQLSDEHGTYGAGCHVSQLQVLA